MRVGYPRGDAIAAIATPPGEGGVAIVRISGPGSVEIGERVFERPLRESHKLFYGAMRHGERLVDSGMAVAMLHGRSYTGEETVELHTHGGMSARRVLEAVLAAGARAALPGEFTYRAFLNGKLDLSQAEAVQELIAAKNGHALQSASGQLEGRLSRQVGQFQQRLTALAAILEAWVDFPEEGLEFASMGEFQADLRGIMEEMERLIATFDEGRRIRDGVSICLVGAPNVGKSSLLNALLESDRAIVTPMAGTTRDLLEASLQIGGLHVRLMDTAGIRESDEPIEQEGIRRSRRAFEEADLQLLVLDASRPPAPEELELLGPRTTLIWNKCDLAQPPSHPPGLQVSAAARTGLDLLRARLESLIWERGSPSQDQLVITSVRHREALEEAVSHLTQVSLHLESLSPEFLVSDLRRALHALGRILGTHVTEEILSSIFRTFCIGK